MLKLGNLKLNFGCILAPMAGISDLAFRALNREFGCELAFVEMISCRAISFGSEKTKDMLKSGRFDRPLGLQLVGSEEHYLAKALEVADSYRYDVLDFNAACPVKKVVSSGAGAALLKTPKKLYALLKVMVKNTSAPVTVKIRSGWDKNSVNVCEVAGLAEEAGVKALFIHGRTRSQGYSGRVDYEIIAKVKKTIGIPVVASGDIFNIAGVKKMFEETGCDAITVARGALGNPWIFRELGAYFKNEPLPPRPSVAEVAATMVKHFEMLAALYQEKKAVLNFRKFFGWYTKGFSGTKFLRKKAFSAATKEQMLLAIDELADSVPAAKIA